MSGGPYTVPTGDGYLGVWQAHRFHVEISIGTFPEFDWTENDDVYAIDVDGPGLAIVRHNGPGRPEGFLDEAPVRHSSCGTSIGVTAKALRQLDGLENGADVRAYKRDEGGMTLVPAREDPFVP